MLPWEGHVLLGLLAFASAAPRSSSFRPIPLPTDFSSYDLNGDAAIDVSELANVSDTNEAQATKPFLSADTNHDGLINVDEFHAAPWDLQGTLGTGQDGKDEEDIEDEQDDYMDDEGRTADEEDEDDEKMVNDDEDDDDNNDNDDDESANGTNDDRGIDGDDEDDDSSNQ